MKLVSRPQRRPKMSRRDGRDARGVALIFVLTTVAILTAIAVDFSYNARVNLELAVQSRDSLRARSLAMSAMNFSRLLLRFQKQLDGVTSGAGAGGIQALMGMMQGGDMSQLGGLASQLGMNPNDMMGQMQKLMSGGAGAALPGGAPGAPGAAGGMAAGGPSIRLWDVVPIDSNAVSFITAAFPAKPKDGQPPPNTRPTGPGADDGGEAIEANFGEFSGTFGAKISDEDQKINVQRLDALAASQLGVLVQLKSMIDDPKYDFIFQEEDANHDRVERNDVILAIKDYIDQDETGSALDFTNPVAPFVNGFGDENGPYSRYKRRYKAKNAHLDSLEELHMVYGVSDAFMTAFGDRLTVWPDINGKLNINTDDPLQMLTNILSAARNPLDPAIRDPIRLQLIMEQIKLLRRFPFIGLSVQSFLSIIEGNGIQVKPEIANQQSANNFFGDKSSTFKIVATGEAGRVKKTLTAVVRYDDGLGQLLYWHED